MKFGFSGKSDPKTAADEKSKADQPWCVIVKNDPVNLMPYVVMVFTKVFDFDHASARKHMLEVHQAGRSTLWRGHREKAEHFVYLLQQWQLTAILEKDER